MSNLNDSVSFVLDDKVVTEDFRNSALRPTTTVLNYLRSLPLHKGVKEGCAEGDCGACTVVLGELQPDGTLRYESVDSCLLFLPMIHGRQLITVENLKNDRGELHPVQQAMVETNGSQCGYCTPGFIMSLFSLYKNKNHPSREEIDDSLTGNLCRCTGYKPIIEAAATSCVHHGMDQFSRNEPQIASLLKSIPRESLQLQTGQQLYLRPAKLSEALSLIRLHPEAFVICGATDVALRVTKKHEILKEIIDISGVEELKLISDKPDVLSIGAGVSLSDAMGSLENNFPALYEMLNVFGSQQIRNVATFGGNLGTASPIGDTLPVLIAYNAKVVLSNSAKRREVSLDEFVVGYRKTARRPDELITAVVLPKMRNGSIVKSYKVSKRKDLDISTVSGGFRIDLNDRQVVENIKLAYGGMAETTKRALNVEKFFVGKPWKREVVEEAMQIFDGEFSPISDARAGAEFRTIAARNLLLKFWSETIS
ncbi:MAG: xanthine dehydrogenase small subunit [Ignavibacteriales bacterium]|nr:xanthine dehydrogenase small subunit [Ignavibacteriales bacterium]